MGYQSHLNHYLRYLEGEGHADVDVDYALSADALQTYQFWLSRKNLRPESIKGEFDPLRGMVKYLIGRSISTRTRSTRSRSANSGQRSA